MKAICGGSFVSARSIVAEDRICDSIEKDTSDGRFFIIDTRDVRRRNTLITYESSPLDAINERRQPYRTLDKSKPNRRALRYPPR